MKTNSSQKNNLLLNSIKKTLLKLLFIPMLVQVALLATTTNNYRDFSERFQSYVKGDMVTIGNTILVPPTTQNDTICDSYTNGPYTTDHNSYNSSYYLCGYQVDAGTTNSTTAQLDIPNNASVIWAGLYWQALVHKDNFSTNMTIKLKKDDNGTYNSFLPDDIDYLLDSGKEDYVSYSAFKDVTTLFTSNNWTDGNYTVANIPVHEGLVSNLGTYGAWSMVVVYQDLINPDEKYRNISVYDGWKVVKNVTDYDDVEVNISGFYTPNNASINSKISVFVAEGDKMIENDFLKVMNANTNTLVNLTTATNQTFNSSISGVISKTPNLINNNGIDIQSHDIGDYLIPKQSQMEFHFTSNQDTYWPSLIAFSTDLYEPSFCYDYSYQQNGKYFTEDNNGSKLPRIEGIISPTTDIYVTLYLRNQENSDILAHNMVLDIKDINTTQAIYKRESTEVIYPGDVLATTIQDSDLSVADDFVKGIDLKSVDGQDYIYSYYSVTPQSISDINISIDATYSYDLTLPLASGGTITIPYTSVLGDSKMPMCAGDSTKYEVDWGIFNVASKGIYSYPNSIKYNLPTQVASQPQEILVTAHDDTSLNFLEEVNSTILIGVDLIDAGKFHSVKASCDEPTSAINPIVWMAFKNSPTIDLRQELQNAIDDDRLEMGSVNEYYGKAVENAAYRVSYITTNDGNESLVNTTENNDSKYPGYLILNNFTELVQDIGTCKQPVLKFPNNDLTTMQVPVACANAGNKGLTPFEYQRCLECLFGYNTHHICSRDNFSIRPESFNIKLKDQNQTNKTQDKSFATDRTGVASPNTAKVNIAAGYAYQFDINATNHDGNSAAPGYTRYFTSTSDNKISFKWTPTNPITANANCNDIQDIQLKFDIIDGTVSSEGNATNVGEYKLNMVDSGWSAVDWDPNKLIHHGGSNGQYFIQGTDCIQNSSIVKNTGTIPSISGAILANINGCEINTNEHNNTDANLKYRDYNITVHPYKFNLDNLNISIGGDFNNTLGSFIYTANVADDNNLSRPMALHVRGTFAAQGYDNSTLNNFVAGCYAKDVNLTLDRIMEPIIEPYIARFTDRNSTNSVIYDDVIEVNATNNLFSLSEGNFSKGNNGAIVMQLDLNFEKNITIPREPVDINLSNFDINCTITTDCQFQADLLNDKDTTGRRDLNNAILTHYYGRVHAPDYEFEGTTGTATMLYEVYCENCDKTQYNVSIVESPDSVFWYLNNLHTVVEDGEVTTYSTLSNVTFNGNPTSSTGAITAGTETQILVAPETPYVDRVQMTPDPWLIYNRFSNTAQTNDFNVKFLSTSGNWAGEGTLGQTIDLNVSTIQNKRLDW